MYNKCVNRSTPRSVAAAAFSRTTGVNGRQSGTRLCGSRHSGTMVPSVPYGSRNGALPFCLKTCSPSFGVRTTERSSVMSEWKPPAYQRGRFSRCIKCLQRKPHVKHMRSYTCLYRQPRHSTALTRLSKQREERNRSSLCCLPHFFRSAFCSALRCFFAIRSAFFCSFAACHSFFC